MFSKPRRLVWSPVVGALGLNTWVSFLLIPLLFEAQLRTPLLLGAAVPPVLLLFVGALSMHAFLLLAAFPVALLLPVFLEPRLVGSTIYSGLTFPFVLAAMIAYTVVTLYALGLAKESSNQPIETKTLRGHATDLPRWRRTTRLARYFALFTVAFPLVTVAALFVHRDASNDWLTAFPQRAPAAAVMFALVPALLWMLLYKLLFARILEIHLRGDPGLHSDLQRLRAHRGRVPGWIYLSVGVAIVSTALLLSI